MKLIYGFLLITFIFTSCNKEPFTGYVVGKEYFKGHRCCNNEYQHTVYSAIVPVVVPGKHYHEWIDSRFILHVANYIELRHIDVDSNTFFNTKILETKTFK